VVIARTLRAISSCRARDLPTGRVERYARRQPLEDLELDAPPPQLVHLDRRSRVGRLSPVSGDVLVRVEVEGRLDELPDFGEPFIDAPAKAREDDEGEAEVSRAQPVIEEVARRRELLDIRFEEVEPGGIEDLEEAVEEEPRAGVVEGRGVEVLRFQELHHAEGGDAVARFGRARPAAGFHRGKN
jgi:hypothetical protein